MQNNIENMLKEYEINDFIEKKKIERKEINQRLYKCTNELINSFWIENDHTLNKVINDIKCRLKTL